jgi:hypothetical protein
MFIAASGNELQWKIECDALSHDDWECLAHMIAERCGPFSHAEGVPTGGWLLAHYLNTNHKKSQWKDKQPRLLVDDVYTTGGSIAKFRQPGDKIWVVFARNPPTPDIKSLFVMET